jgi:hypothetical protein
MLKWGAHIINFKYAAVVADTGQLAFDLNCFPYGKLDTWAKHESMRLNEISTPNLGQRLR